MKQFIKDFKSFIIRGNVVDLAVAVVVGAAFNGVVQSLVKDLITPLIAAFGGGSDFSTYKFTLHNSQFLYGDFINAALSFLLIALVVFTFVVAPVNRLLARYKPTPEPTTRKCPHCLSDIPKKATRCAFCTQKVEAASR